MARKTKKDNNHSCQMCSKHPCFIGQDNCKSDFGKEGCELWKGL